MVVALAVVTLAVAANVAASREFSGAARAALAREAVELVARPYREFALAAAASPS